MPTGMLPPSGFVCFVPRSDVVPVKMSVEDAAKIIISAGMVNPETQAKLQDMADQGAQRPPRPAPMPGGAVALYAARNRRTASSHSNR